MQADRRAYTVAALEYVDLDAPHLTSLDNDNDGDNAEVLVAPPQTGPIRPSQRRSCPSRSSGAISTP